MNNNRRKVVVTGLGVVSPIGIGIDTFWNAVKNETNGIGPITLFDKGDIKVNLNAEVKNFDPKDYLDPKSARRLERYTQFALISGGEAIKDSCLDMSKEDPYRVGVSYGCGVGSIQIIEKNVLSLYGKGPRSVEPLIIPLLLTNISWYLMP